MNTTVFTFTVGLLILIILLVLCGTYIVRKIRKESVKLQTNEQYYQSLYEENPDMVITVDLEGNFLSINKVVEHYGYAEEELLGKAFISHIVPEHLQKTIDHFNIAKQGKSTNYNTAFYNKNGERYEVNVTNVPIFINKKVVGVYSIVKDTTDYNKVQEALIEAESIYRGLTENSLVGIHVIQDGKLVYVNQKLIDILGYSKQELIGSYAIDFIYSEDQSVVEGNINRRLQDGSKVAHYQYRIVRKDQTIKYMEVHGSTMIYQGKPAVIGTVLDITERKNTEEKIQHLAYHDSLTGLANRDYFCDRIEAFLMEENSRLFALLSIDLDQYKLVNDAIGRELGDQLLKAVSERLMACTSPQGAVGRNGGDEFLVFLPNMSKEEALVIADQILNVFSNAFQIDQYELYITLSIGISLYPNDGENVDDLIKKADTAMYQVKRNGKNSYEFYSLNQQEKGFERLGIETQLRKALVRDEFELYYQPKVDLFLGKIVGAEALIRWNHPEKGFISPAEFIPVAEEMGLIIPIGEWVLSAACKQMKVWQEAGVPDFVISVNLSVRQLYQPNLVERVQRILNETGLDSKYLELEITESMMVDSDHALKVLNGLKNLGVKISLDDFGTGFSSLHYLKEAPIHTLKIDQSFVRHCTGDTNNATIVKAVIAMAHQLKLDVVAEGVETVDHLIFLQQNQCDVAQGYLFSKPLPPIDFELLFTDIEKIVNLKGIPKDLQNKKWMEKSLGIAHQELIDTIRHQQGMTFKFIYEDGKFIHTFIDGELVYRLGLVPEKIIGNELRDFQSIDEAKRKTRYYRRAWEGEQNISYEAEMNGVHYLASLRPIAKGGKVVEVIASCVDITKRKQAEEALRQSEENNRLIAEHMSDFIVTIDVNGSVIYASPSHETIFGLSPSFIEGRSIFRLVEPSDFSLLHEKFEQMLSSKSRFQVGYQYKNIHGDLVYLEAKWIPVFDEKKEIKHIIVASRDISEIKKTKESG